MKVEKCPRCNYEPLMANCKKCGSTQPRLIHQQDGSGYLFKCKQCGRFSTTRRLLGDARRTWNVENDRKEGATK